MEDIYSGNGNVTGSKSAVSREIRRITPNRDVYNRNSRVREKQDRLSADRRIPVGQAQVKLVGFRRHKCEQPPLLEPQALGKEIFWKCKEE
jgi:hypothetical protein